MISTDGTVPPMVRPISEIMPRSWVSSSLAMAQPAFTSPTRLRFGTTTSVKKVSQNTEVPLMSWIGRATTPGLRISNSTKLMPPCLGWLAVRTKQKIQSARWA